MPFFCPAVYVPRLHLGLDRGKNSRNAPRMTASRREEPPPFALEVPAPSLLLRPRRVARGSKGTTKQWIPRPPTRLRASGVSLLIQQAKEPRLLEAPSVCPWSSVQAPCFKVRLGKPEENDMGSSRPRLRAPRPAAGASPRPSHRLCPGVTFVFRRRQDGMHLTLPAQHWSSNYILIFLTALR